MALKLNDDLTENHEINVTPFIDVMLVLLIVFMVAAPLSTVDVPVELPVAVAKAKPRPLKPIFISLKADNSLAIGSEPVQWSSLIGKIDLVTQIDRDTRLYIRADKSIPYGKFMLLMNKLRLGGYLKVGLVGLEGGPSDGKSAQQDLTRQGVGASKVVADPSVRTNQ